MGTSSPVIDPKDALARASRRDFIKLAGLGGVVLVSGFGLRSYAAEDGERGAVRQLASAAQKGGGARAGDFYFVQLSDTHWGFEGPAVNPDAKGTLEKAVAAVNGLDEQPDFVVFTGDLTHTTDDDKVRRERMARFQDIASRLKVKTVHYLAGEHDAALDQGEAFRKFSGNFITRSITKAFTSSSSTTFPTPRRPSAKSS
jgi:Calcineurin-like phosphoesterase